jgi:hypothetical protein
MVEREGFAFKLKVVYEWLPNYSSHCQIIGHDVTACRWLHPKQVVETIDHGKKHVVVRKRTTQKYVEKHNPDGIGRILYISIKTSIPSCKCLVSKPFTKNDGMDSLGFSVSDIDDMQNGLTMCFVKCYTS